MLGLATGGIPPRAARLIAAAASLSGLGRLFVPGARHWHVDASASPSHSRTSSDPERFRVHQAWFASHPELRVDGPTYGWLDAAFRLTERVQRDEFLAGIDTPILIGSAGIDLFVDRQAHRRAAACLRDCAFVELPHSKHEPFLESDAIRQRWFAAIDRFLDDRLPRRESSGRQAD